MIDRPVGPGGLSHTTHEVRCAPVRAKSPKGLRAHRPATSERAGFYTEPIDR